MLTITLCYRASRRHTNIKDFFNTMEFSISAEIKLASTQTANDDNFKETHTNVYFYLKKAKKNQLTEFRNCEVYAQLKEREMRGSRDNSGGHFYPTWCLNLRHKA